MKLSENNGDNQEVFGVLDCVCLLTAFFVPSAYVSVSVWIEWMNVLFILCVIRLFAYQFGMYCVCVRAMV